MQETTPYRSPSSKLSHILTERDKCLCLLLNRDNFSEDTIREAWNAKFLDISKAVRYFNSFEPYQMNIIYDLMKFEKCLLVIVKPVA